MPSQTIRYCDQCQRRILPSELASGNAIEAGGVAVCPDCFRNLPEEAQRSLMRGSAQSLKQAHHADRPKSHRAHRRHPAPDDPSPSAPSQKSPAALMGVFAAVGLVIGLIVVVLMPGAPESPHTDARPVAPDLPPLAAPAPSPRQPVVAPVASAPAGTPVQNLRRDIPVELKEIEGQLDEDMYSYDDVRAMLTSFIAAHPGPTGDRAKALLAEIDARYEKLAARELERAVAQAATLVDKGQPDAARSALRLVRARFRDKVAGRVEEELRKIDERVASAATAQAAESARAASRAFESAKGDGALLYVEDFENGSSQSWGKGSGALVSDGLPPGSRGAIRQNGNGNKLSTTVYWNGLFPFGSGNYLNYTFTMKSPGDYFIFMMLKDPATNYEIASKNQIMDLPKCAAGEWKTVSVPLVTSMTLDGPAPEPHHVVVQYMLIPINDRDLGMTIDRIWVTKGPVK